MTIAELLAGHRPGDEASLTSLAVALAQTIRDPAPLPEDPVELYAAVEDRGAEAAGTWQEVRAARDYGQITPAEYDYLAAAVEALSQED